MAAFAVGACVVSAGAVLSGPSGTHRVPTPQVGLRDGVAPVPARTSVGVA